MPKLIRTLLLAVGVFGSTLAFSKPIELGTISTGAQVFSDLDIAKTQSFTDVINFSILKGYFFDLSSEVHKSAGNLTINDFFLTTTGSTDRLTPVQTHLAGGDYTLMVAGKVGSTKGSYTGSLTISNIVSAVPEPETYAMLLAGLGLIGMIGRRRQKAAPSVFA